MAAWETMSGAYVIQNAIDANPHMVLDAINTRFYVLGYLDVLSEIFPLGKFLFYAFPSLLLIVIFTSFWYLLFIRPSRRFANL